jgi:hypothetical protein
MADLKLPYVIWRGGRPRFQPSARERALGFANHDLRHPDKRWYTFEEAQAWADAKLAEIKAARASGRKVKRPGCG